MSQLSTPSNLAPSGSAAEVLVACVTYNSAQVIGDFLASLPAALAGGPRCRVVVVDNNSSDATVDLVRQHAPWAHLVSAGGNLGYAGGINLAMRRYPASEGVYVLNPDTVPAPGSVSALHQATQRDPSIGIVVPRIVGASGQLEFSLRREPTLGRALGHALLGGPRAARWSSLGEVVRDPANYRGGAQADWATGAAVYFTRAAIDAAGDWDERFFLYSEETDYCLRVRDAGFTLQLVTAASVMHHGGDQAVSAGLWALSAVNRTRLYRKRHGRLASTGYWAAVLLNEVIRVLTVRDPAGRAVHRSAVRALRAAGPDQPGPEPTTELLARAGSPVL